MSGVQRDSPTGRIEIRADCQGLTPYAGLAVTRQLIPRLRLVELLDAELAQVRRAAPVNLCERGLSAGELLVSLAKCQLVGGECFSDVEDLRADAAGAALRSVAAAHSAETALELAKRFRRSHTSRVGAGARARREAIDHAWARLVRPVTIDPRRHRDRGLRAAQGRRFPSTIRATCPGTSTSPRASGCGRT